jgi:hypothetical protein
MTYISEEGSNKFILYRRNNVICYEWENNLKPYN